MTPFPEYIKGELQPTTAQEQSNHLIDSLLNGYHHQTYSRQLVDLTKLYENGAKYPGRGDVFDYRFKIFLTNCQKADIPKDGLTAAFEIMLKDEALTW